MAHPHGDELHVRGAGACGLGAPRPAACQQPAEAFEVAASAALHRRTLRGRYALRGRVLRGLFNEEYAFANELIDTFELDMYLYK